MTKQVSFSATISALTMTLFALAVAIGNFHDERAQNAATPAQFAVTVQAS